MNATEYADLFAQATAEHMATIRDKIGTEYKGLSGITWILHSCNDLGVPYFHKRGHSKLYTWDAYPRITDLPE